MRNNLFKDYAENEAVRLIPGLFCFQERKLYKRLKQVVSTLVLICFGSSPLVHTIGINCITV